MTYILNLWDIWFQLPDKATCSAMLELAQLAKLDASCAPTFVLFDGLKS